MLDSSVIFALDNEEPDLREDLVAVGDRVVLLVTHIQKDEDKRGSEAMRRLPFREVATSHFALDHSRLGWARLGPAETLEPLRERNPNHTEDALIAASAAEQNAILVVRDGGAVNRIKRSGFAISVWGLDDLKKYVASIKRTNM